MKSGKQRVNRKKRKILEDLTKFVLVAKNRQRILTK